MSRVELRYVACYLHHRDLINNHDTEVGNVILPSGVAKITEAADSGLEKKMH